MDENERKENEWESERSYLKNCKKEIKENTKAKK